MFVLMNLDEAKQKYKFLFLIVFFELLFSKQLFLFLKIIGLFKFL